MGAFNDNLSTMTLSELQRYAHQNCLSFGEWAVRDLNNILIGIVERASKVTEHKIREYDARSDYTVFNRFLNTCYNKYSSERFIGSGSIKEICNLKCQLKNNLTVEIAMCEAYGLSLSIQIPGGKRNYIKLSNTCHNPLARYLDKLAEEITQLQAKYYNNYYKLTANHIPDVVNNEEFDRYHIAGIRQSMLFIIGMVTPNGIEVSDFLSPIDNGGFEKFKKFNLEDLSRLSLIRTSDGGEWWFTEIAKEGSYYNEEKYKVILNYKNYNSKYKTKADILNAKSFTKNIMGYY